MTITWTLTELSKRWPVLLQLATKDGRNVATVERALSTYRAWIDTWSPGAPPLSSSAFAAQVNVQVGLYNATRALVGQSGSVVPPALDPATPNSGLTPVPARSGGGLGLCVVIGAALWLAKRG